MMMYRYCCEFNEPRYINIFFASAYLKKETLEDSSSKNGNHHFSKSSRTYYYLFVLFCCFYFYEYAGFINFNIIP